MNDAIIERRSIVSEATLLNWERLNAKTDYKLRSRANKTCSEKKVLSIKQCSNKDFKRYIEALTELALPLGDIIFTLCVRKLENAGVLQQNNAQELLLNKTFRRIDNLPSYDSDTEDDFIGNIYQSMLSEGSRNLQGVYYTTPKLVLQITKGLHMKDDELFLDPCCGSGMFLCNIDTNNPQNIYGTDIDPIAVMIARTNLICKYKGTDFTPNVFCLDFLQENDIFTTDEQITRIQNLKFDYIFTNPPWGNKSCSYKSLVIKSKERASLFLEKASKMLNEKGLLHFLIPTSLLKIRVHSDIRKYIINQLNINQINFYTERFCGVFTDIASIELSKTENQQTNTLNYIIKQGDKQHRVTTDKVLLQPDFIFPLTNETEQQIISKVERLGVFNLSESIWALGIVTGNNKEKVLKQEIDGSRPIFKGTDIEKFRIKEPTNYIVYDRSQFQQCAKDEIYSAKEKLIYKFISKKLVFAYDDKASLVLNSANILIPNIKGMSIKSVMAFLNSDLYQFIYDLKFNDLKVLKGNLSLLVFPEISSEQDLLLQNIVNEIMYQNADTDKLNDFIFKQFDISQTEQEYIKAHIYG